MATHRPIPRTFRFDQQTATKSLRNFIKCNFDRNFKNFRIMKFRFEQQTATKNLRTFLKCNFDQNLTFLHFRLGQSLQIFSFQNEIHSVFGGNHFRRWWWKDQRANQAQMYFFTLTGPLMTTNITSVMLMMIMIAMTMMIMITNVMMMAMTIKDYSVCWLDWFGEWPNNP